MTIPKEEKFHIPLIKGHHVTSLCWQGDELVDMVSGGTRYGLNGKMEPGKFNFAYRFDRAIISRDGQFSVIYEAFGTKGLVLRGCEIVREINRSFYQAHIHEYPIVILDLPGRQTAIAHCPNGYNKIEIEEIESGRSLTVREDQAADFFHSRLQMSPDGEHLLSAGRIWQSVDHVALFRVRSALQNPTELDRLVPSDLPEELFDVHATAFQDNDCVIMAGDNGGEPGEDGPFLIRYDIWEKRVDLKTSLAGPAGTMMPVNGEFIVAFHEHPKLIEIATGKVVQEWPELNSREQNSSINRQSQTPPLALDSARMRFAMAGEGGITVIQLGIR